MIASRAFGRILASAQAIVRIGQVYQELVTLPKDSSRCIGGVPTPDRRISRCRLPTKGDTKNEWTKQISSMPSKGDEGRFCPLNA